MITIIERASATILDKVYPSGVLFVGISPTPPSSCMLGSMFSERSPILSSRSCRGWIWHRGMFVVVEIIRRAWERGSPGNHGQPSFIVVDCCVRQCGLSCLWWTSPVQDMMYQYTQAGRTLRTIMRCCQEWVSDSEFTLIPASFWKVSYTRA